MPHAEAQYFLGLLQYYGEGVTADHSAAMKSFREAALQGHPQAATNLAMLLEAGHGGAADAAAAFAWYKTASDAGEKEASYRAGLMLYESRVPDYDERERLADAFIHFERAVEKGHPASLYYLGLLYEYGAHKPQNFETAAALYAKGCEEYKDVDCCYNLGLMYAFGRGIPQDWPAAVAVWQQNVNAAGHAPSALYLGLMYANGHGVKVDYDLARVYFQQASGSGDVRVAGEAAGAFAILDRLISEAEDGINATLTTVAAGMTPPKGALD